MCQTLISFAAGTIIICDEIAIMTAASHQQIAILLAMLGVFAEIGGAIGLTVSAAIWQDVLPKKLAEYFPASGLTDLPAIYEDLTIQLSYPVGSPGRIAIQDAYGDAQKMILIAGTAIWDLGVVAVVARRDSQVIGIRQTKSHVFLDVAFKDRNTFLLRNSRIRIVCVFTHLHLSSFFKLFL